MGDIKEIIEKLDLMLEIFLKNVPEAFKWLKNPNP